MGLQGKIVSCKRCAHGNVCLFQTSEDAIKCSQFDAPVDRDALLALADMLKTPEQDADCSACPLRKWCETELYNGHSITCHECKTWHTADVIREACGGQTA